jgi:Ca2+-binding RTX toxin-like protein
MRALVATALIAGALGITAGHAAAAPTVTSDHRTLIVNGSAGDDRLALRVPSADPKVIEVDFGDDGSADVVVKRAAIDSIRVQTGAGDDAVRAAFARQVPTTLDGGLGVDVLTLEGSGADDRYELSAKGTRVRVGGDASMSFEGVESFEADALGGADSVTVGNLTGTELQDAHADLGAGDGRRDCVVLEGTAGDDQPSVLSFAGVAVIGMPTFVAIENAEPADRLVLNGRGGDDLMSSSSLPHGAIDVTLDGGPGTDVLIGGDGDETLIGGPDFDDVEGRKGDDVALLGPGIDRFTWRSGDGNDSVDGQGGHDVLFFFGSNDAETLDLSAHGRGLRLTRDVGAVSMDLDRVEEINPIVFGGADTVEVGDLSRTAAEQVNVNLQPTLGSPGGDGQADRLLATGTDRADEITVSGANGAVSVSGLAATLGITHAEGSLDSLGIETLGGADTLDASGLAPGTIALTTT